MSRDTSFTPKSLSASEYAGELFKPGDNVAILVRNRGTGKTVQRIAKAETVAGPELQEWLAVHNASGSDVFVGMNPIKDGAYSRTKDNIEEIRHVYLDLDRHGDQSLEAIRDSSSIPAPNFVLDTSPGKHQVVWRVSGFSQDEAESLLRSLATEFGGDRAATDSTRVLRLPGFANRKLSEHFIVQVRHESQAVTRGRSMPSDHKSQSERDWAYVKRALARGDDPELVIRRIADYRSEDKADPDYYARHTVHKAQADLQRVKTSFRLGDTDLIDANETSREK